MCIHMHNPPAARCMCTAKMYMIFTQVCMCPSASVRTWRCEDAYQLVRCPQRHDLHIAVLILNGMAHAQLVKVRHLGMHNEGACNPSSEEAVARIRVASK